MPAHHGDPRPVTHPFGPLCDARCRVLVLGSMPSPRSREACFYYANPQNRFWPVMAALWDEELPPDATGRARLALRHHVALWDVLASCTIAGASDSSISEAVSNDLAPVLASAPIERVFCTGVTAGRLYRKLIEPGLGMGCTVLPSTSPANARMRLDDLVRAYAVLRDAADPLG